MTIADLEQEAGITDRTDFWMSFAAIPGYTIRNGKLHSKSLEAGIAELKRLAAKRRAAA